MTIRKHGDPRPTAPAAAVPPDAWVKFFGTLMHATVLELATRHGVPMPAAPDPPGPGDPPIPPDPPTVPPVAPPNALAAIVRISAPGVGCSATIIGPRRADGRWWVLTAQHCQKGIGQVWSMRLRDGRTGAFTIVSFDKRSDHAWGVTASNDVVYPYALLAERTPAPGTPIWHAGYGVHIPSNREEGTVTAGIDSNGQVRYSLSVSSGDSGGGIIVNASGEVLSPVCCTSRLSGPGSVWGASPESCRAGQRDQVDLDAWEPIAVPLHESAKGGKHVV